MTGADTVSTIQDSTDGAGAGERDLTAQPAILRCRALLSEDRSAEEFEIALETLLDRLELDLSQRSITTRMLPQRCPALDDATRSSAARWAGLRPT